MLTFWILVGLAVLVAAAVFLGNLFVARGRALDRLFTIETGIDRATLHRSEKERRSRLSLFLSRAGFRRRGAATRFLITTLVFAAIGALIAINIALSDSIRAMLTQVGPVAGIGELYLGILNMVPWFVFLAIALIPVLVVRASRRRVIMEVDQDLSIILDLLATLGEVGLGLDAAISKILEAQPIERTLTREFRTFQLEGLAGMSRIQCLRRLAERLDAPAVTLLVSALVQAEQTGAGWAGVLRRQADDVRSRRREQAMADAHTLPVKLTLPLAIGFLPALFVWTLGPALQQFVEMAERLIR